MLTDNGYVFLVTLVLFISKSSWFEILLKLNLFGFELYFSPIKYGNLGFLKFLNMPSDAAVESNVAK